MKKLTLQINAPVNITITVSSITEDLILNAAMIDLKDPNSENDWKPSYGDLKEILNAAYFEDKDWENFIENDEDFIVACS